jgi:AcrR family transcriptional regulator
MGRPQEVDVDALLDHARAIWVADGVSALTTRALIARSGVSNGAFYHHFESRNHLLARVWAREAAGFRAYQRAEIEEALRSGTPADAVVAAGLAVGGYASVNPESVRVLLASRPDKLTSEGLPDSLAEELAEHRTNAARLIADLAFGVWGRRDAVAVKLIQNCTVDIPARIYMGARQPNDPLARHAIEHAIRGILEAGPPA